MQTHSQRASKRPYRLQFVVVVALGLQYRGIAPETCIAFEKIGNKTGNKTGQNYLLDTILPSIVSYRSCPDRCDQLLTA